jgi:hypothetical protein
VSGNPNNECQVFGFPDALRAVWLRRAWFAGIFETGTPLAAVMVNSKRKA